MSTGRTDEIRRAVAAGDWQTVMRLWDIYAAAILGELGRGTCTAARMSEAREFLEWAKRVALCGRAHAQNRLNTIYAVRQYDPQPSQPLPSLRTSL